MMNPPTTACREWPVWSTTARVVVTDATRLERASAVLREVLAGIELACSRFTPDSELAILQPRLAEGAEVSPLLAELVRVALDAARLTRGAVDPTLGNAMVRLGYDRDFPLLAGGRASRTTVTGASSARASRAALAAEFGAPHLPVVTLSSSIPGWRRVGLSARAGGAGTTHLLSVPADLALDLGATAKAFAADRAAARIAREAGCGVLVALGGDIATAGAAPSDGGWQVTVEDLPGDPSCQVTLAAGHALATSSTQKRRWRQHGQAMHHILDPARGLPADPVWRTVTVAAPNCVEANTFSTASVVLGSASIGWLAQRAATARLVDSAGRVLTLGGWPDENSVHVREAG